MAQQFTYLLSTYGYPVIFLMVFLQEIGTPSPLPNEFILLSAGFAVFKGLLKFPLVLATLFSADLLATFTLHTIFFFSGTFILRNRPKWIPFPEKRFNSLKQRINEKGISAIYIGRLLPIVRGYTAVIAGLLQVRQSIYLPVAIVTATLWSSFYLTTGYLLGPVWNHVLENFSNVQGFLTATALTAITITLTIIIIRSLMGRSVKRTTKEQNIGFLSIESEIIK